MRRLYARLAEVALTTVRTPFTATIGNAAKSSGNTTRTTTGVAGINTKLLPGPLAVYYSPHMLNMDSHGRAGAASLGANPCCPTPALAHTFTQYLPLL